MKLTFRRRFWTALLSTATAAALVSCLASCALPNLQDGPYLRGLKEHCNQVTSRLVSEGIDAHCDDNPRAVIQDNGATFTFDRYGLQSAATDVALITDYGTLQRGKIAAFTVMVGGGFDAPKAIYTMKNLARPRPFYTGDNLEWVQRTIETAISTEEMKTLVERAEHYQELIKTELDNLKGMSR